MAQTHQVDAKVHIVVQDFVGGVAKGHGGKLQHWGWQLANILEAQPHHLIARHLLRQPGKENET